MTSSTEDPVPELALENDDVTNSKTDSFEEELSDAALNEEEDNNFDVDPVDITIEEGVDPDQDINLNNGITKYKVFIRKVFSFYLILYRRSVIACCTNEPMLGGHLLSHHPDVKQ